MKPHSLACWRRAHSSARVKRPPHGGSLGSQGQYLASDSLRFGPTSVLQSLDVGDCLYREISVARAIFPARVCLGQTRQIVRALKSAPAA